MGYTHYFTQTRSFAADEWVHAARDIAAILSHVEHAEDTPLANGGGEAGTHPEIGPLAIRFNGLGDNSGDTFVLRRIRLSRSEYCKTNWRSYDLAVTACLCYLSSVTASHTVSSDGHAADFRAGLAAARAALPHKADRLQIPIGVMQKDRA